MFYSDLVITGTVTQTSDCSSALVVDTTGTYPEEEGGYAPEGEGTATRPTFSETQRWVFYRRRNADGTWTEFIPNAQNTSDPYEFTISLLDEDGEPYPDSAWQVFIVVVDDTLSYSELLEEGYDLTQFVEAGLNGGAVGAIGYYDNCTGVNCLNWLQQETNNAYPEGCNTEDLETIQAWVQAATDNIAVGGGVDPEEVLSPSTAVWFTQAAVIIERIIYRCGLTPCPCNC